MDVDGEGDGALPRNVSRKPSTSTGKVKSSTKRLQLPNKINSNSKRRKSLSLSSSISETFQSVIASSNNLDIHSENVEFKAKPLDISSISDNEHAIRDSQTIYNCKTDKHQICNKGNKRVAKNTKYADFITNNEMETIIGDEDQHCKKTGRKSIKSNKVRSHITPDVINEVPIQGNSVNCQTFATANCKIQYNNEPIKFDTMPRKSSSSKKRKKLSDQDETDRISLCGSSSNHKNNNLGSTSAEQSNKPTGIVNKRKRKSVNKNKKIVNNSLTGKQQTTGINVSTSLINSNNEPLINSNSTNKTKPNNRNSQLNLSRKNLKNKSSRKSRTRASGRISTKRKTPEKPKNNCSINDNSIELQNNVSNENFQPTVLMKYDVAVEKIITEKNQTVNRKNKKIIKSIDPNVYDATLLEIKAEEEIDEDEYMVLDSNDIMDIDFDDVKIEEFSPCSSNSDLSELFSPIRDCHIHLERLYVNANVPKYVKVVNSFNKVIPNCKCKGLTQIQKKCKNDKVDSAQYNVQKSTQLNAIDTSRLNVIDVIESVQNKIIKNALNNVKEGFGIESLPTSSNLFSNASNEQTEDINTKSVSVEPSIVPEKINVPIKSQHATSIVNPKNSKRKSKLSPVMPIADSHVVDIIEEVIKSSIELIEFSEKQDSKKVEVTKNVDSVVASKQENRNEDTKNSTITPPKNNIELPVKSQEKTLTKNTHSIITNRTVPKITEDFKTSATDSMKNDLEIYSKLNVKHLVSKTQTNNASNKSLKSVEELNSLKTTSLGHKEELNKLKHKKNQDFIGVPEKRFKLSPSPHKTEPSFTLLKNIKKTPEKVCLPVQETKTPSPKKLGPTFTSNIVKTPQKAQISCLPRKLQTTFEDINKLPQQIESQNVNKPICDDKITKNEIPEKQKITTSGLNKNVEAANIKKIIENSIVTQTTSTTINKNIDLREILSKKRIKETSDKYKNLIIQTSANSNRVVLKNPTIFSGPNLNHSCDLPSKTLNVSPNKSTLIQIQRSPINDNIKNLFKSNLLNEASDTTSKTVKSSEIKIRLLGTTQQHFNLDKKSQLPNIITQKLEKICNEQRQEIISENEEESTENQLEKSDADCLQITSDNDIDLNDSLISQNESNTEISQQNESDVHKEQTQVTKYSCASDTLNSQSQEQSDNSMIAKPKHTFKFIEKCEVKRPPSRKPGKIKLNRPILSAMPPPASAPASAPREPVFKAPIPKKIETRPYRNEPLNKYNNDDDVISILADTTGMESVCDAASVRNNDSDDDIDLNEYKNEHFVDTERFEQVKDWLSNSVDEPVTVVEPIVTPIKKISEIPVARVNPGIQNTNLDVKLPPSESNTDEQHSNIKSIPEDKKCEDKKCEDKKREEKKSDRPIELELFKNICYSKFKKDICLRKVCHFSHSLPNNWQNTLKSFPVDALMRIYNHTKIHRMGHLYKILLAPIAEQLGSYKDFNNITILVKDVLEMNINTDREPLINKIIQVLMDNGFSFYSTVEIVFRSANVVHDLKNLLCDILLNITVERRLLEDDWPIIQMLSVHKKFDIDKGIIQFIIIEALAKSYLQKELVYKVYNDLIKRIPEFNMKTISATLCQKFVNLLRKYNLPSDADELFNRCVSLNILEKPPPSKKFEEHRIIPNVNTMKQDFSKAPKSQSQIKYQPQVEHSNQEHTKTRPLNQYQIKEDHSNILQNKYQLDQSNSNQNQYQQHQEQLDLIQKQEVSSRNQYQLQDHLKLPQNQNQKQFQPEQIVPIQNQHQVQQKHQIHHNTSNYQKNPMPDLRVDQTVIDQQNYTQFYRSTQSIKSYVTENHATQPQPSTSSFIPPLLHESSSQDVTIKNQTKMTGDDYERFSSYSTENLDLLANTATQNLMKITRDTDMIQVTSPNLKPFVYNFLSPATDQIERHSADDLAPNIYKFPEVKQFVAEENCVAIMQLIRNHKEGNSTDAFLNHLIDAFISTPHNYPTFFSNLSDMSAMSNDDGLNYMLKTLGVNLVLYLCQNNQYDPAFRINNVLTIKYKTNDFYDVYNCKIYLKNKYSFFKRILIIAELYIIKGDIQTSWNMLRDNVLSCASYWQSYFDEADLQYRDFVLAKLFESFKKIKNSNIALDALLYIFNYKVTDICIREHVNSILVNAINNRCSFDKIIEFMNISSDWYKYLDKNTIRAILVTAYLERRNCVSNIYEIAFNLRICPQLMGNEKIITLYGHYHYAELILYLDKYFQNMVNFMPIVGAIKIFFSINDETSNDEIPLLMHQYNSSKAVLATRVVNILENMVPPIKVLNRNTCLYLDPDSVNTHLLYRRQQSSL